MSSVFKKYIGVDVLTEAKKRIHHIYDIHDDVVVSFSGGKDSLAVLHLVKEVSDERGIGYVNAVFRDEEVIPFSIVEYLTRLRDEYDWMRLKWLTVPSAAHTYILGKAIRYTQWDATGAREWIRPKPAWSVNLEDLKLPAETILHEDAMDDVLVAGFPGKIALLNGVRADESLVRFRSSVNKLNENYINASNSRRANFCKPIFDWVTNDVFRYFYDRHIGYCSQYEDKMWAQDQLRVATAINVFGMKHFKLRQTDPALYQRVMEIWPELAVQERYWRDLAAIEVQDVQSFEDVYDWIRKNLSGHARTTATKHAKSCEIMALKIPRMYPPSYVLHTIRSGEGIRHMIMPLSISEQKNSKFNAPRTTTN